METFLSICIGLGLSAACGFRVFVPMFFVSVAASTGHLTLAPTFQWLGTDAALIIFGVATVLEVGAFYIPWLDNFLDTLATPAAIVAGTILTAAMVTGMSPVLKWTLAVIAGGGIAGTIQAGTALGRGASTLASGGLTNPLYATVELGGSVLTSAAAVFVPLLVVIIIPTSAGLLYWRWRRLKNRPNQAKPQPSAS